MKNRKQRIIWLIVLGIGIYLLAVLLLAAAERQDPNASIQSFADALWYSVVTVSTVGYGDFYPITSAGRILGLVFVVLSVGLLSFVIGAMVSLLTGNLLPGLRLWLARNRTWFVFSAWDPAARALAADLRKQYPEGCFLFPGTGGEPTGEGVLTYSGSLEQLLARKQGRCRLFFLEDRDPENYGKAVQAASMGFPVSCMTELTPDHCPEGLTLLDRYDCCAQEYWRSNGLEEGERRVILIGEGSYARQLLLRGLMTNVRMPERTIRYDVFGNWEEFRAAHYCLGETLALNREAEDMDSLFFHCGSWTEDPELIRSAHRIILCADADRENLQTLQKIRRYFPTGAKLHLRSAMPVPGEQVFGTDEQIFTGELILRSGLTRAARAMHEIYRESTGGQADVWEELSDFLRQSNIAAADHLLVKIRLLLPDEQISHVTAAHCAEAYRRYRESRGEKKEIFRRIEHLRWMRFHSLYNWRYSPVRDNGARLHPLMLPYEQLPEKEQEKDDYAWELLGKLASREELN